MIRGSGLGIQDSNHILGSGIRGFAARITFSGFGTQDSRLESHVRDSGFGSIHILMIRDSGLGIRNSRLESRGSGLGIRDSNHILGARDSGLATRVTFSGFGIQGLRLDSHVRESGLGIRDSNHILMMRDSGFGTGKVFDFFRFKCSFLGKFKSFRIELY